ncbi:uncharacterized protein ACRADG_002582 [Cochliomyia hominivorax]
MVKFVQILFVAFLAVALCSAETPRSRTSRFQVKRNRFLARQEAAEPAAVTPYPSADELKPEIPFDEAVAAEEQQPNQPDEVYGPPEEAPVETDDVPVVEEETAVAEEEVAVVDEEQVAAEEEVAPARLTARRTSSVRRSSVRPAKLRKALPAPARLQLQPQVVPQPIFYYVAQ